MIAEIRWKQINNHMNLYLDDNQLEAYTSNAQKIRVMTEGWFNNNIYCPRCGFSKLQSFTKNKPVADFYCDSCHNEYELKSKSGCLGEKILDGAYHTMIERITNDNNPDFFFLSYKKELKKVNNLIVIPKFFFIPEVIEKRKPLSNTARRAGWTGCNILLSQIPTQGRIYIIKEGKIISKNKVVNHMQFSQKFELKYNLSRSWLMDVLNCINSINKESFTINEIYSFEDYLFSRHPKNNNIKAKIRQQLQFLRDKDIVEFIDKGKYRIKSVLESSQ